MGSVKVGSASENGSSREIFAAVEPFPAVRATLDHLPPNSAALRLLPAVLLGCAALNACSPGGEVALRARASGGAGGQACLDDIEGSAFDANWAFTPESDPALSAASHRYFTIRVLDSADRSPIAGASLRTNNDVVHTADDNGVVAYYEPGLMEERVFFFAERAGYEIPKDAFGYRGKALDVSEGGSGELLMNLVGTVEPLPAQGTQQTRRAAGALPKPEDCFAIRVVDQATKRGVPLVTLRSGESSFVSDSQGYVADCEPDALGPAVEFEVSSHGYRFEAGAIELPAVAGTSRVIEITRENIAERLYRVTGQGIHRDSALLGLTAPLASPLLSGKVSAQGLGGAVIFGGKLLWAWGTTARPSYPLANFGVAAATSELPNAAGLDPRSGVDLSYFVNESGETRNLSPSVAPTSVPTWLSAPVVVPDANGDEQLIAVYVKPNGDLSVNRRGLLRFDAQAVRFDDTGVEFPLGDFVAPSGEPLIVRHGEQRFVYYGSPLRVPASAEALLDLEQYEVFSALPAGGGTTLETEPDGSLAYDFKVGARASTAEVVQKAGLPAEQALDGHWQDALTGTGFRTTGAGAQSFNQRRGRFLRLVEQVSGSSSFLGEIWYAESDTPMGPWVYARKVVTHDRYSFSSPLLHPYFEQDGGRFVFFEGSYTSTLAGEGVVNTPRYDSNELMYRLDLDDPRLALPVPIYDASQSSAQDLTSKRGLHASAPRLAALFFAPDRASPDTLPVFWSGAACESRQLLIAERALTPAIFYAYPVAAAARPGNAVPLYDFENSEGEHVYDVADARKGFTRAAAPFGYVWPSPIAVRLPVADYLGELVADAGSDQCLREPSAETAAEVTLRGSASSLEGDRLSYEWRDFSDNCLVSKEAEPVLRLAAGVHAFTLTVRDAQGRAASDDVLVSVAAAE